jgi:hypothetical protein
MTLEDLLRDSPSGVAAARANWIISCHLNRFFLVNRPG